MRRPSLRPNAGGCPLSELQLPKADKLEKEFSRRLRELRGWRVTSQNDQTGYRRAIRV